MDHLVGVAVSLLTPFPSEVIIVNLDSQLYNREHKLAFLL